MTMLVMDDLVQPGKTERFEDWLGRNLKTLTCRLGYSNFLVGRKAWSWYAQPAGIDSRQLPGYLAQSLQQPGLCCD